MGHVVIITPGAPGERPVCARASQPSSEEDACKTLSPWQKVVEICTGVVGRPTWRRA
jgi:hypothetical protein